jgi:hypothetical protein
LPFQPTDPIVAIRDTDPDVDDLVPLSEMHTLRSSRYERNSGQLPRLGNDPEWAPPGSEFVSSIIEDEPRRWFALFRR